MIAEKINNAHVWRGSEKQFYINCGIYYYCAAIEHDVACVFSATFSVPALLGKAARRFFLGVGSGKIDPFSP
jgi:hypothetical protein